MADIVARTPVRRRAILGWVLFDPATQPFYTLITTFVFAPFFAAYVASDPVLGQSLWGYASAAAGLIIALLAPAMGAVADAGGGRKRWIAFFALLLAVGSGLLWFAVPGAAYAVPIAIGGFIIASIGAEFATVFNNAMMPDLVHETRLGRLSGVAWAAGYLGGLVSLVIVLGLLAADPTTGRTLIGLPPLFGLDPANHGGDRASGPFTAIWFLILVLPLFLFTPDRPHKMPFRAAIASGLAGFRHTLRSLPSNGNAFRFLVAQMIYADGLIALFAFGGIYAASVYGWSTPELGLFGILLTITGTIGGVIGGILTDRLGPKAVVMGALIILFLASLVVISIDRTHVFFLFDVAPTAPGDGLFASAGERLYLALGAIIGAVAGPLQSASRVLLVVIAPRARITEYFGLFALSGKLTSFMGPLSVASVTLIVGSQRAGIAMILVFFALGGLLLAGIRVARNSPH